MEDPKTPILAILQENISVTKDDGHTLANVLITSDWYKDQVMKGCDAMITVGMINDTVVPSGFGYNSNPVGEDHSYVTDLNVWAIDKFDATTGNQVITDEVMRWKLVQQVSKIIRANCVDPKYGSPPSPSGIHTLRIGVFRDLDAPNAIPYPLRRSQCQIEAFFVIDSLAVGWLQLMQQVFVTPQKNGGNASMAWDGANNVYFYQPGNGNGVPTTSSMWQLNLQTMVMTRIDQGNLDPAYNGATVVYAAWKLYFLRGGDYQNFYSLTLSGTLAYLTGLSYSGNASNLGACLRWDGADTIWAFAGNIGLAKYSIANNTWTNVNETFINNLAEGTSIALVGNLIYAMAGGGQQVFKVYNITGNTWTALANPPGTVYDGGQLAWDGGNYVYAFRGIGAQDFWRFNIATGLWEVLGPLPVPASEGSTLYYAGHGSFFAYISEPEGITSFGVVDNLYRFTPG